MRTTLPVTTSPSSMGTIWPSTSSSSPFEPSTARGGVDVWVSGTEATRVATLRPCRPAGRSAAPHALRSPEGTTCSSAAPALRDWPWRGSWPAAERGSWCSRSEEHTSELQSHSDLVCRLLLEKKKKNNITCYFRKRKTINKTYKT